LAELNSIGTTSPATQEWFAGHGAVALG
jgi:hypothetical protein